jgi:hypothetical protein
VFCKNDPLNQEKIKTALIAFVGREEGKFTSTFRNYPGTVRSILGRAFGIRNDFGAGRQIIP